MGNESIENLLSSTFVSRTSALYEKNNQFLYYLIVFTPKYVFPFVALFGIVGNILNMIVLANKKLKTVFYKYFLVLSTASFLYILVSFAYFFVKYSFLSHHLTTHSYGFVFFKLYIYFLFTNLLNVFVNQLFIVLSLRRLLILTSVSIKQASNMKRWLSLILFSTLLLNVPNFFLHNVEKIQCDNELSVEKSTENCYTISTQSNRMSRLFTLFSIVTWVMRGLVLPLTMLIINLIIFFKFRAYLRRKAQLKSIIGGKNNFQSCYINYFILIKIIFFSQRFVRFGSAKLESEQREQSTNAHGIAEHQSNSYHNHI